MHAWRIRRQHNAEDRALGLVADWNTTFLAVTAREDVEIEASCQRRENSSHVGQHELVLLHIRAAHLLG
jgi:hypothetical protein